MMLLKKGIILVLQLYLCNGILTGNDDISSDVTYNPGFGCQWYGGQAQGVECNCRSDEPWTIDNNIPIFDTTFVRIKNCRHITFKTNSIQKMRNLRNLHLESIAQLELEDGSLKWYGYKKDASSHDLAVPSLKIQITNSVITSLSSQTFSGRISEILLQSVRVSDTSPFTFSNLVQTEKLTLKNVHFENIRPQTFKKFELDDLELTNVTARIIPSRMFSDVTVHKLFTINNCNFHTVRSLAFVVLAPKYFEVSDSYIDELDSQGFMVTGTENIVFRNNIIYKVNDGAFKGLESNKMFLTLDNNTFSKITRESLAFPESTLKINKLYLNETCDCLNIEHRLFNPEFFSDTYCVNENEYLTINRYKSNFCSLMTSKTNLIIIVSVVCCLLLVIAIALAIFLRKYFRSNNYGNKKQIKNGQQLSLIVPDGRTYRETELHVIVEKTDLLTTDL